MLSELIDGQYNYDQLDEAFDKVVAGGDWRNPIDCWIPATEKEVTIAAILYFTATKAWVQSVKKDWSEVRLRADGYRMGPAGP